MADLYKQSSLYNAIYLFCKARHITISDMCKSAGISAGIITDLKMGRKKSIQTETAIKIAQSLEIPVELLYNCQYHYAGQSWDVDTCLKWLDADTIEDKLYLLKEYGVDENYLNEATTLIIAEAIQQLDFGGRTAFEKPLNIEHQEFVAFDGYLENMGYRLVLELATFGNINPEHLWTLYDNRNGKRYFVSSEKLNKLMDNINSYTKFQISELISELPEAPAENK